MILWQNKYSPFARKVLVLAHELGVRERISLQDTDPHSDESLRSANPLCKIPTLILDDGRVLYDSRVICEYLLTLGDASRVAGPPDREAWEISRGPCAGRRHLRCRRGAARGEAATGRTAVGPVHRPPERRDPRRLRRARRKRWPARASDRHRRDRDRLRAGLPRPSPSAHRLAPRPRALAEWFADFSARQSMALTSAAARS